MNAPRRRIVATAEGTSAEAFGPAEWGLLAAIASMWGSSFLFISVGLDALEPGTITLLRILLGTITLAAFPAARRGVVDRADRGRIAFLGIVWMALPFSLLPVAQQWVDSAVAGMLMGAVPLTTTLVATVLLRRLPGRVQLVGLAVGFLGILAVSWPQLRHADAGALGIVLVVLVVTCYGLATNVAVPLQQRYGSMPVLLRALVVALVAVTPFGLVGLPGSHAGGAALAAMIPLGAFGTGLAFVAMTTLVGRSGASRGSVAIYFVPPIALALGVLVRGEHVEPIAFVGAVLVVAGAWLTSRAEDQGRRYPALPEAGP